MNDLKTINLRATDGYPPALFVPPTPFYTNRPQLKLARITKWTSSEPLKYTPRFTQRRQRYGYIRVPTTATAAPSSSTSSTEPNSNTTGGEQAQESLDAILSPRDKRRYIFFGGKGGVGKTSTSAAAAIKCADEGLSTLLISTDPAHSLGDALQLDLSHGRITRVDDTIPLYAVESDPREAVDRFRSLLKSLTPETNEGGGESGSGGKGWVEKLGLSQLGDVLQTIPPGADELIALSAVLDVANRDDEQTDEQDQLDMGIDRGDSEGITFDRVIIDTAPTGHTLRMLTLPDFLEGVLGQALRLRERLTGGGGTLNGGVVGTVVNRVLAGREKELEEATRRVSKYKGKMEQLSTLFRDPAQTEFVVVSIATALAVAETKRLIDKLWDDGVWVRHIVINQLLPNPVPSSYVDRVRSSQARHIAFATEVICDEYGLSLSIVPRFDADIHGIYALQSLARVAFRAQVTANYGDLFVNDDGDGSGRKKTGGDNCQFVFVSGKGGVGKTSIAGSMGYALAEKGFKSLVLSTDPAHSLGDSLQCDLSGGSIERIADDVSLYALEIDAEKAIKEFQKATEAYLSGGGGGIGLDVAKRLGLDEFARLLDNAPPGIDEVVALTQVLELIEYGDFQRVIIDTAPTGHTLRLLSLPEFLDSFLGKISALKSRLDRGLSALKSVLGGGGSTDDDVKDNVEKAARNIDSFRRNMVRLNEIIRSNDICQFVIVSIPTALAMAESQRLVQALNKDGIAVNNLVVNQVVPDSLAEAYASRVASQQDSCVEQLDQKCEEWSMTMIKVALFDAEVRGIYGLRALATSLFS